MEARGIPRTNSSRWISWILILMTQCLLAYAVILYPSYALVLFIVSLFVLSLFFYPELSYFLFLLSSMCHLFQFQVSSAHSVPPRMWRIDIVPMVAGPLTQCIGGHSIAGVGFCPNGQGKASLPENSSGFAGAFLLPLVCYDSVLDSRFEHRVGRPFFHHLLLSGIRSFRDSDPDEKDSPYRRLAFDMRGVDERCGGGLFFAWRSGMERILPQRECLFIFQFYSYGQDERHGIYLFSHDRLSFKRRHSPGRHDLSGDHKSEEAVDSCVDDILYGLRTHDHHFQGWNTGTLGRIILYGGSLQTVKKTSFVFICHDYNDPYDINDFGIWHLAMARKGSASPREAVDGPAISHLGSRL